MTARPLGLMAGLRLDVGHAAGGHHPHVLLAPRAVVPHAVERATVAAVERARQRMRHDAGRAA
jgi:hypothetical protein